MSEALARMSSRLRDERGMALVMAMGVLFVISVSLTSVIYFTSTNARSSDFAKEEQSAVGLAEAGLNNALAAIFEPDNDVNLDDPDWLGSEASPFATEYAGGRTVRWYGQLNDCAEDDATGCNTYWLLTATAEVANPTGPGAAPIRRTLTVRVPMKKPSAVDESIDLWNWVYNNQQTGSECDMSLGQGVAMYVPLYVKGNLCMTSTSSILHNGSSEKPTSLVVGGNLSLKTSQNSVGTAGVPLIGKVRVAGWCQYWNKAAVSPCQKEQYRTPPPGNVYIPTNVFASDFSNDLTDSPLTLPPIYWWSGDMPDVQPKVGWYEKASPGPRSACNAASTGTSPTWDTNAVMDASVPGIFNLTPPDRSYSCKTRRGELTWDHIMRRLTVSGVIFIDGNVEVNNNTGVLRYVPSAPACTEPPEAGAECNSGAVIYVGGTVNIKGSKLCGVVGNNTCDWDNWQPNMNILVFAAYQKGLGQVNADESIQVENSHFQGALYGKWAVDVTTAQTKTQGPLVSETEVKLGQQAGSWFPPIEINPLGMPGAAPKFSEPQQPDYGSPIGDPTYG